MGEVAAAGPFCLAGEAVAAEPFPREAEAHPPALAEEAKACRWPRPLLGALASAALPFWPEEAAVVPSLAVVGAAAVARELTLLPHSSAEEAPAPPSWREGVEAVLSLPAGEVAAGEQPRRRTACHRRGKQSHQQRWRQLFPSRGLLTRQ